MRRKSRIESPLVQSNNLRSGIYTDRNALDFYVAEVTLENKCMPCFQDYDYMVRKGAEKMYQVSLSSPTSIMNQIRRSNRKREYAARTNEMRRGKQNLERVYFYLRLCA